MKAAILISAFGTIAASIGHAETAPKSEMRDSITHEQLVAKYRQASQNDPMLKQAPSKGPDPSTVNKPKSLLGASDLICFNGAVTLVPKRAVLQAPKNLAERLKYLPGAKLLAWSEFYALNRGWITTVEVSRTQAEGNSPLPEETQKQLSKSGNLIVATYQGGPISVLPLKVPEEKTAPISPKS
ncbi:MAG: hypothetical protein V4819_22495 [Verrucomicrobiota bacterium]